MRQIIIARQMVALVDDEDFDELSKRWWSVRGANNTWYAWRQTGTRPNHKTLTMHGVIMNPPPGMVVDHIDHNGLNNCRSNLRIATFAQNSANRLVRTNNTSGYKGVAWYKRTQQWRAHITFRGITYSLGYYETPIDAALAYDAAAHFLNGEFAVLNFPAPI